MDIVDRIEVLCRNSATNITALEKELGLGHGRIRKWKDHSAQSDSVALIARKFNVTTDYLILGENWNIPIPEQFFSSSFTTNRENELIEGFRELNEEGQNEVLKFISERKRLGYIKNHSHGMVQRNEVI